MLVLVNLLFLGQLGLITLILSLFLLLLVRVFFSLSLLVFLVLVAVIDMISKRLRALIIGERT